MTQLASNLRAERARKSLSQAELAEKAGTSATTVANIEGGQGCRYSTLLDLAKALDIPVGVLLAESNGAQQSEAGPRAIRENQSSPASKDATAPRGAQVSQPAGGTAEASAAGKAA